MALDNQTPLRAASVFAQRNTFFMLINKKDYKNYIEKADAKVLKALVEQFKQVHFMEGLSDKSIAKLSKLFDLERMDRGGKYVLREGEPVTHIALVKEGEFEVVKKNLKGVDDRVMTFLRKGDVRKRIAKQVMMLRGRGSIYQKTSQLIPPFERNEDDSFLRTKNMDIEQLAFDSVSDKLVGIARTKNENF